MESTQTTAETKQWTKFEISIGTVEVFAIDRDSLNLLSPNNSSPWVMLTLARHHGRWIATTSTPGYSVAGKETPAPAGLMEELVTLGGNWAIAHPEEFEREAAEQFEHLIGYIVEDSFGAAIGAMDEAEEDLTEALNDPELIRAPAMLRSRVADAAKMVHAMKLQVEAAAEAIDDAACEESDEGDQH
jgi:hypothetical protein